MSTIFFTKRALAVLLVALCVALYTMPSCEAMPRWLKSSKNLLNVSLMCHNDDELLQLCERCSKLTRSKLAHPSCCSTDLIARKWCYDYVYYGKRLYDFFYKENESFN